MNVACGYMRWFEQRIEWIMHNPEIMPYCIFDVFILMPIYYIMSNFCKKDREIKG